MEKPHYGIDAPGVIRNFVLLAVGGIGAGFSLLNSTSKLRGFGRPLLTMGIWFGATALVRSPRGRTSWSVILAEPWATSAAGRAGLAAFDGSGLGR